MTTDVSQHVQLEGGVSLRLTMDGHTLALAIDYPGGSTVAPIAGPGAGSKMLDLFGRAFDLLDAYEAVVAEALGEAIETSLAHEAIEPGDVNHPIGGGVDEEAPCDLMWPERGGEMWCQEHARPAGVCAERGAF